MGCMSSRNSDYGDYYDDDYYYYYYDPYDEIDQNKIYSTRGSKARNSRAEMQTIRSSRGAGNNRNSTSNRHSFSNNRSSRSNRNSRMGGGGRSSRTSRSSRFGHTPHYDSVHEAKVYHDGRRRESRAAVNAII